MKKLLILFACLLLVGCGSNAENFVFDENSTLSISIREPNEDNIEVKQYDYHNGMLMYSHFITSLERNLNGDNDYQLLEEKEVEVGKVDTEEVVSYIKKHNSSEPKDKITWSASIFGNGEHYIVYSSKEPTESIASIIKTFEMFLNK